MLHINWVTAFLDMPAEGFEAGTEFWLAATGSTLSPRRGPNQEFATLIPSDGTPHLRVQRTQDGGPAIHLDLHVSSVPEARTEAEGLGATFTGHDDQGFAPMRSPSGLSFCFVPGNARNGQRSIAKPVMTPAPNAVDQVCVDIPSSSFEAEVRFWSAMTGWEALQSQLGEFRPLARPAHVPIRLLLQRLGQPDGATTAHLDLSCGSQVAVVAAAHNSLGAEILDIRERWTVMRDPAGRIYCLTSRDPVTGLPPG